MSAAATADWLDPLYDAEGMGAIDRWAIDEQGVPSLELMEAAGAALARETERIAADGPGGPIRIICGKGNNGGDGLVAARMLRESGHDVEALLLWPAEELSEDAAANLRRLDHRAWRELGDGDPVEALAGSGAVIDAIFGTGFAGEPREPAAAAITAANELDAPLVACDVPSGVDAATGEAAERCVDAELTVTFHRAKLGHRIAPGKWRCGEVVVAAIGIPEGAPQPPAGGAISTRALELPPRRGRESTKFASGEVVIVGGSRGMTGAVCMASLAAIRAGAGYATAAVPDSLESIFEIKLTEVMTVGVDAIDGALDVAASPAVLKRAERAACVVLGPGLGRTDPAAQLARHLVPRIGCPLLIDADGLNALGTSLDLIGEREAPTVLTPHAGELSRLLGCESAEVNERRLACARRAAEASGAVVVLKGDDTLVIEGDRVAISVDGTAALATAGTGDVLSGTIAALIARGTDAFEGACAGVLAHARAGRAAADRVGVESVIATDVVESLPDGLRLPS